MTHGDDGAEVLRHLSVIENQVSCATAACHAHPETNRVLGVLDLEMSMRPVDAAGASARRQVFWTTSILIMVVGVVVAIVIRRFVQRPHRPVIPRHAADRRRRPGDADRRARRARAGAAGRGVQPHGRGPGAARREVTEWSQKLEEKVVEKTEELRRAQRQVLHMEKMASLGKLSATVAHELNNPISGMLNYARLVRRELAEAAARRPTCATS